MRKFAYVFIFFLVFNACNNPASEAGSDSSTVQSSVITPADEELMSKAKDIFQPLPAKAENPDNPITGAKVRLGKLLYYDTRLSKTGNNSCNSCHNLSTFGVDNLPTSKGDAGKFGDRNSPTVLNAAIHTAQFWDGRAKDVEQQAGMPVLNPVEMAIPSKEFLVTKLRGIKQYQDLFKEAYPTDKEAITYDNLQKSIGAFERTLLTPSKFDKYLGGDNKALTSDEKAGLKTFMDVGCTTCHAGAGVGGAMFQKFGVYADYRTFTKSKVNDEGKKKESKQEADKDFFKVPSLRNCEKTQPYFHDGSISSLAESIKIMGKAQLNKDLTGAQVSAIVAFLGTLTADVPEDVKEIPAELAISK